MQKKTYQLSLAALLIIVLAAMVLQFKLFGREGYWFTVLILAAAWLASKWLLLQQKKP